MVAETESKVNNRKLEAYQKHTGSNRHGGGGEGVVASGVGTSDGVDDHNVSSGGWGHSEADGKEGVGVKHEAGGSEGNSGGTGGDGQIRSRGSTQGDHERSGHSGQEGSVGGGGDGLLGDLEMAASNVVHQHRISSGNNEVDSGHSDVVSSDLERDACGGVDEIPVGGAEGSSVGKWLDVESERGRGGNSGSVGLDITACDGSDGWDGNIHCKRVNNVH